MWSRHPSCPRGFYHNSNNAGSGCYDHNRTEVAVWVIGGGEAGSWVLVPAVEGGDEICADIDGRGGN